MKRRRRLPLPWQRKKREWLGLIVVLSSLASLGWQVFQQVPWPGTSWKPLAGDPQPTASRQEGNKAPTCKVLAVLDGDTLGCDVDGNGRLNGKGERIRLLGIDAPETRHSPKNKTGQDEPGAQAAKQQLTQWALHQHVLLTFDKQHRDRYQRRLAYVYRLHPDTGTVETQSLNEKMIRQGLVRLLFIPPNRQLKALFQQAQREAAKPAPLPPASQDDRPG